MQGARKEAVPTLGIHASVATGRTGAFGDEGSARPRGEDAARGENRGPASVSGARESAPSSDTAVPIPPEGGGMGGASFVLCFATPAA